MPRSRIHKTEFITQNFNKKRFFSLLGPKTINMRGFTLVELLVVLAIMGILAAIGLARYSNFSDRQQVRNTALELKSNLRKYQNFATSGQKNPVPNSPDCVDTNLVMPPVITMQDYSVEVDNATNRRYRAVLNCTSDGNPITVTLPWVVLPGGVNISAPCSPVVRFLPLSQGVNLLCGAGVPPTEVSIVVWRGSDTHTVYVTSSGDIYER